MIYKGLLKSTRLVLWGKMWFYKGRHITFASRVIVRFSLVLRALTIRDRAAFRLPSDRGQPRECANHSEPAYVHANHSAASR
jgi:hypothetical protein